jgi:hypothetical protein
MNNNQSTNQKQKEMDIVFNCIDCGEGIIKNSWEHDECICIDKDGEIWRCGDCQYNHLPTEQDVLRMHEELNLHDDEEIQSLIKLIRLRKNQQELKEENEKLKKENEKLKKENIDYNKIMYDLDDTGYYQWYYENNCDKTIIDYIKYLEKIEEDMNSRCY